MTACETTVSLISSEPLFAGGKASQNAIHLSRATEPLMHHISKNFLTLDKLETVSPQSSIDDSSFLSSGNIAISSSSLQAKVQDPDGSFGSLGLPSEYPRHYRYGSGVTPSFLDDHDDFREIQLLRAKSAEVSHPAVNPFITIEPNVAQQHLSSKRHGSHRRSNALLVLSADFNPRRRRRNEAQLSTGDYNKVLQQDLSSSPISIQGKLKL